MKHISTLSIPEQAILYSHYSPVDTVAKQLFDIDDKLLHMVKRLAAERFAPRTVTINPDVYADVIKSAMEAHQPARTATKRRKPRGLQGLNIIKAFAQVPVGKNNRVDAEEFAKEHNVAVSSLRQYKRFDRTRMDGSVKFATDAETKNLMVWRNTDGSSKT